MTETLNTIDGRPALRIERRFRHSPEKVWRAITEPDQLSQWYPFRVVKADLRPGGAIQFDDGDGGIMHADVVAFDPPRIFSFSEHAPTSMDRESDDLAQFELSPDGDGCLLVFTHIFDDRPAAASYATGWVGCLDVLSQLLDEKPLEWAESSAEVHDSYITAFGLDEGTVEDTSDGWRVRFDRQLRNQSIDDVWSFLTREGAPAVGSDVPAAFGTEGITTVVEPPTVLEYTTGAGGSVRWELSNGPGGARITLTQEGPADKPELRAAALTKWRRHLEDLAETLRKH